MAAAPNGIYLTPAAAAGAGQSGCREDGVESRARRCSTAGSRRPRCSRCATVPAGAGGAGALAHSGDGGPMADRGRRGEAGAATRRAGAGDRSRDVARDGRVEQGAGRLGKDDRAARRMRRADGSRRWRTGRSGVLYIDESQPGRIHSVAGDRTEAREGCGGDRVRVVARRVRAACARSCCRRRCFRRRWTICRTAASRRRW